MCHCPPPSLLLYWGLYNKLLNLVWSGHVQTRPDATEQPTLPMPPPTRPDATGTIPKTPKSDPVENVTKKIAAEMQLAKPLGELKWNR